MAGVIFWFIVIGTGATLGVHHKQVQTAQDAAAGWLVAAVVTAASVLYLWQTFASAGHELASGREETGGIERGHHQSLPCQRSPLARPSHRLPPRTSCCQCTQTVSTSLLMLDSR